MYHDLILSLLLIIMLPVALAGHSGQAPLLPSSFVTSAIQYLPQATPSSVLIQPNFPSNIHTYKPTAPGDLPSLPSRLATPQLNHLTSPADVETRLFSALRKIYNTLAAWAPSASISEKCHIQGDKQRPSPHKYSSHSQPQPDSHESIPLHFLHDPEGMPWNKTSFWTSGKSSPEDWSDDERVIRNIPSYVLEYAPLVHLYSEEEFWPCDIADHLLHTSPYLNYTPLEDVRSRRNLSNLDDLNKYKRDMYLTSDDNVEDRPEWLEGRSNIPYPPSVIPNGPERQDSRAPTQHHRSHEDKTKHGGRSDAPVILIVVDKGHGVVDAFWWFFYSYNLGNKVLNVRFGNHVGDWEHTLVRFQDGKPDIVFFSEHYDGVGYSYAAVEKIGKRVRTFPYIPQG